MPSTSSPLFPDCPKLQKVVDAFDAASAAQKEYWSAKHDFEDLPAGTPYAVRCEAWDRIQALQKAVKKLQRVRTKVVDAFCGKAAK